MILYFLYCYAKNLTVLCYAGDNCVYFYLTKTLTVFFEVFCSKYSSLKFSHNCVEKSNIVSSLLCQYHCS